MFGSSLSLTLRAARSGPACGCPDSFLTNLSLRRQDAEANIAKGDGPKGAGRDARSQLSGFVHAPHTSRIKKSPFRGSF